MDRKVKVNLPPPPTDLQNKYPAHPLQGVSREPNLTSSSSSSSAAAPSPPDFLRHVQAVFKRHRPLATMPSNLSRARRVLVPQTGSSNQRKGLSGEEAEDSSLPPPPVTGTVTAVENVSSSARNASSASLKVETSSGNLTAVKGDDLKHEQLLVDPMTRCSVVGSSCAATTMSVHSGPTFQTAIATQMSSVDSKVSLGFRDQAPSDGRAIGMKGGDALDCKGKEAHNSDGEVKGKGVSGDISIGRKSSDQNVDFEPSQAAKGKKILRKKKHDPDLFFKVNGKLYQKLGKIGSGGSSEVYKVISSDCTIYALKQINLKGRDYATACGFCQEIGYLNNLKGNANIIQLIDYEVTDKILLEEVMNGCVTRKDCRIRDDEYIYMVLEYGEIDLAHMLSQKWKEMDASSYKIDENWLRFYWQQMLEAVNTIHEERIVHSDLKPANFLLVKGILRLIDFGIAKSITSDTTNIQRDAQVGTLNYMSPEAFIPNEQEADGNTIKFGRPSDIWSLGCILYQMVYGKTPFAEYKTFWAKFKVITDRSHEIVYQPLSNPWLIDLMKKCLAWERNERWRIPQLLQHPFLVPPLPRELPCAEDHAWKLFIEQIQVHWNEPQVTRLRNQFQELLANLEKRSTGR